MNIMYRLLALLIAFSLSSSSYAQKKIQALFSYCTFYNPEKGPYVETYLSVNGSSAEYKINKEGKYQSEIEVTYLFKQGEEIKQFDKFKLLSPELADSNSPKLNFLDQQRIAVPNGKYMLEIKIKDVFSQESGFSGSQEIELNYDDQKMSMSSIELLDRFTLNSKEGMYNKSGIEIIPYISDFYPENVTSLKFYTEIYNSIRLDNDKYLVKYYVANYQNNLPIPEYTGFARQTTAPVNVVIREFNISKLKTGNYYLVVEARNKDNVLLAYQSTFFQRTNLAMDTLPLDLSQVSVGQTFAEQYKNLDTLRDHIRSMRPIADETEKIFIDKNTERKTTSELENLQKYFYAFWYKRNALNPELEWRNYQYEVRKVNDNFSTSIKRGYQTDRGRVYLQYGAPNTRVEIPSEPNSYPYEIWQYLKVGRQNNGRFVFYSEDLVTNDFTLLHSTVFGEPNNERWDMQLQRRNTPQFDLDQTNPGGSVGSRARDYFDNPR